MKINQIIIILSFFSFCISQDKGLEYYQNQEYEEAKNYYENIIIKSGENVEAHFGSGASSYQKGDWELAKESFQETLKSADKNLRSKAFYNLGNTFYKNNKTEEAISLYRKALEINPNDKEARFNYEYLKYQKKPPEDDNKEKDKQESILDALKQDEKIMQKKQISRAKSRKLAKDW